MTYEIGQLSIDEQAQRISLRGRPLAAAPRVVQLLAVLSANVGAVLTREALIDRIWGDRYVDDSTLSQAVYLARQLLKDTGQGVIETYPRRGYRLVPVIATPLGKPKRGIRARWIWAPITALAFTVVLALPHAAKPAHSGKALNPRVLHTYNLGIYYLRLRTVESLKRAIIEFSAVAREAPQNALGYAGLSQAYSARARGTRRQRKAMITLALAAALDAVHIDPTSVAAQTALAVALEGASTGSGSVEVMAGVDAAFRKAIALDGSYAPARFSYGEFLLARGNRTGAFEQLREAVDLDPAFAYGNVVLGHVAYLEHDLDEAIHFSREGLGFGSADKVDALQTLAYAYESKHDWERALQAFHQLQRYAPAVSTAGISNIEAQIRKQQ